jgi:hypothetical protein
MILSVPSPDEKPWPTLGPSLVQLLEERAVHGPGDLKGQPYRLDPEKKALIYRAYEVYPRDHERAGQRRFKDFIVSLRKGSAKTEFGAAFAFLELHPEAEIRTDGWRRVGSRWEPIGRPVVDPYIPMVAYTEEQTDELAYRALFTMITEGPDADLFDAGLDRIIRLDERGHADGTARALAAAPDSRDGARTTFQHFDETHRFTSQRLVKAHETMQQNIPKRPLADPWSCKTTTAFEPGEGSVHEVDFRIAEKILAGKSVDPSFFFFHRYASDRHKLETHDGLRAAIVEASGPSIMGWPNSSGQVENIASLYQKAKERGTEAYWERVWLNRPAQSAGKAFNLAHWKTLGNPKIRPILGSSITIGLDGSRWRDSTGIVCTDIERRFQWKYALWTIDEKTPEIPLDEVEEAVEELFKDYDVQRFYYDPAFGWGDGPGQRWEGKWGGKVARFETGSRSIRKIADATQSYVTAVNEAEIAHDGDEDFATQIGQAYKYIFKGRFDDEGQPIWALGKGPGTPPPLMDLAVCGVLSWQAYLDVIASGWTGPKRRAKMRVRR